MAGHESIDVSSEYHYHRKDQSNWAIEEHAEGSDMILQYEVCTVCQLLILRFGNMGTAVMTVGNTTLTNQGVLRNDKIMPYFRETSIWLF